MVSLKQHSKEEIKEMSFLELAHVILTEKREPISFDGLLSEIKKHLEISDAEIKSRMVQFYTDLNIDGSFLSLGENRWGLRAWYPVEKLEEETTNAPVKTRKKKAKKAVIDDFDEDVVEEEEEIVDFGDDGFDDVADDLDVDDDEDDDDLGDDLDDDLGVAVIDDDLDDDEDDDEDEEDFKEEGVVDEYDLDDK